MQKFKLVWFDLYEGQSKFGRHVHKIFRSKNSAIVWADNVLKPGTLYKIFKYNPEDSQWRE